MPPLSCLLLTPGPPHHFPGHAVSVFPSRCLLPPSPSPWCRSPHFTPPFPRQVSPLSSQVPQNCQITGRGPAPGEGETVNRRLRPGRTARKEFQRKSYCCREMTPSPLSSPPSRLWQQQQEPNCKDEVGVCWLSWKGTFFFPQAHSEQAVCHPLLAVTFLHPASLGDSMKLKNPPYILCRSLSKCHVISCLFPFGIMPRQCLWTPKEVSVPCYQCYWNPSAASAGQGINSFFTLWLLFLLVFILSAQN